MCLDITLRCVVVIKTGVDHLLIVAAAASTAAQTACGVPLLNLYTSFHPIQERFSGPAHITRTVYTNVGEGDVADPLARVAAAHGAVSIGSYPNTKSLSQSTDYRVKLSFSSRDAAAIEAAVAAVREVLPVFDDLPTA